ncbi:MAG: hypothetical protein PWR17_1256 [Candidatus Methanomethylophilaceae archaeon]|nr:hypothetical protein [Candidatus Methanomethylophilaceae archaeon]
MGDRVRAALPGFIVWTFFLLLSTGLIIVARTGSVESFLMVVFAMFSAAIATEGAHELLGHRPIGTLKEFSSMSREELSMYDGRRISAVNGILHIISGFMVSASLFQRAFFTEEFILVLFFRSLIPVAILLALGSYWVNYGRFFKNGEGRKVGRARDMGATVRTSFSLFVSIGSSYGLARLFELI